MMSNKDGMGSASHTKACSRHLDRDIDNSPHYWSSSLDRGKGGIAYEVGTPSYRVCHS